MSQLLELVRGRKSVRTFDGTPVSREDRERLAQYMEGISNPFGIPVRFVLLDAKENGLSSPVLSGETLYVAGIVGKRKARKRLSAFPSRSWCCTPGRWGSGPHGSAGP